MKSIVNNQKHVYGGEGRMVGCFGWGSGARRWNGTTYWSPAVAQDHCGTAKVYDAPLGRRTPQAKRPVQD